MYQFYYAESAPDIIADYQLKIQDVFQIEAVRPTMWEEHCLECSAPACFSSCLHYLPRSDGRCKRFADGIFVSENKNGCCGQAARLKFRKWGNMMTIIFPAMLSVPDYQKLTEKNESFGKKLSGINRSKLPQKARWESIRTLEYLRRRDLRKINGLSNEPDAFVFHGFSFEDEPFRLILEVYNDHEAKFRTSLDLHPGENLIVIDKAHLAPACWAANYLVKVYPEKNREAEIEILWCDFVKGKPAEKSKPAEKVKCLVWDLDNTLWDGILIESEENSLQLRPGVSDLLKALDERGILQSVASKNDFDPAWQQLKRLGVADYFLYPQIHWNAKSESMRQIAKELNIGLDTLALLDDSAFEREQVSTMCPQVRTYDISELSSLPEKPEFSVVVTEESRNRRAMYKAEEKRNQVRAADNSDTISFLKQCHLRIHLFEPQTEEELLRCYELVARTNQLNMSGTKYTPDEFKTVLERPEYKNFAFRCEDDFGSYGIVGFGQYTVKDNQLVFTEFAMSCRVAGKYVESALFAALLDSENCKTGIFEVQLTNKNALLRRTLEEIGFSEEKTSDRCIKYRFNGQLKEKQLVKVFENE
jgi:FkbH-like protein